MDYNSELYVCRVNFDKTYKNVVDFFISGKSKAQRKEIQLETFKALAINHLTDFSPIMESDGSGVIEVRGSHDNWLSWNYIVFCNPEFSSRWIYAFIDFVDYEAPNTTLIHYTIDVWQTFHLETAFYESWIDRSHIAKSDDVLGANLEGEPFSATPIATHDIKKVGEDTDWSPRWVLHSCSKYDYTTDKYLYGGNGGGDSFGEYGFYIDNAQDVADFLEKYGRKSPEDILADMGEAQPASKWQNWLAAIAGGAVTSLVYNVMSTTSIADLSDHRNELIGLYAIPEWAKGSGDEADNTPINKTVALSLTTNLACGYTPRNAKMLSSVFKAYILYARNGTLISYKPEAFTAAPSITLSCIPMGTSKYYAFMDKYGERNKQFLPITYAAERRVGYDQNTGLNKIINAFNAGKELVGSAMGTAGSIVASAGTGDIAGAISGAVTGAGSIVSSGLSMVEALDQQAAGFGRNSDLMDITQARAVLRWADVSPSYNECVHIDKFLDMYGYAQNTIGNLYNAMRTRPRFNYIKSSQPNLRVNANDNFNEKMKNIFSSGLTIWHDISYMYDFDTNNF